MIIGQVKAVFFARERTAAQKNQKEIHPPAATSSFHMSSSVKLSEMFEIVRFVLLLALMQPDSLVCK